MKIGWRIALIVLVAQILLVQRSSAVESKSCPSDSSSIRRTEVVASGDGATAQDFYRLWSAGSYLAALDLAEGQMSNPASGLAQLYQQFRPALDGYVVVAADACGAVPAPDAAALERFERAIPRDAIDEIVTRAASTRIVIVNEAHDNPRDRAFVLQLAEALAPIGYNVYAAEAFTNWGTAQQNGRETEVLMRDGYPRTSTGLLINEPMFGFLVRRVLELGYRPAIYEFAPGGTDPADPFNAREQAQAENLAQIISSNPDARILIHVGYSHVEEGLRSNDQQQRRWMANRLKELTGIDPLTIDQTGMSEFHREGHIRSLYAAISPRVGDSPKVFFDGGVPVALAGIGSTVDLQVVHPRVETWSQRPSWLRQTGRQPVAIPQNLLPRSGRRLVQIFASGDADGAVPLDQVLVFPESEAVLFAPPGQELKWVVDGD